MKLNSPRKSGWRGRYGWRNIFDVFIREKRQQKKILKAVEVITKYSSVPIEKSLVIYQPAFRIKPIDIPVPMVTVKTFAFVSILFFLAGIIITVAGFIYYIKEEIDYRSAMRYQVNVDIQKALEPYQAKQNDLYTKVLEHDEIIVAHPVFRKKLIQKYKNAQTGEIVEREVWK